MRPMRAASGAATPHGRVLVPRAARHAPGGLHLALKSGNFGSDDFFTKAFARLA